MDERGVPTIIDFGARVGGNLSSIVHWVSTGVDLVTANIEMALGRTPVVTCGPNRLAGNFALHSSRSGRLRSLELSHKLRSAAHTISMALAEGDSVRPYRTSADRIGSVVITGDDRASLEDLYADPTSHVRLTLDEEDR